ncbi:hypothetical protein [Phycicoccus jejuensis]|uniref:hypothetical protein n=1 Tax=Phycicoccus jejuensis TaxID=367299 RepID=UPI00068E1242|nr:hypothetical protein [Phycicoccus jejuensis]
MAFLRLAFFPGATTEHWAAVVEAVGEVPPPPGRRAFAAGPAEGGWQVVQLWDTEAGLERFNAEVFGPALARLGGGGFPAPPVVRDVHTTAAWVDGEPVT